MTDNNEKVRALVLAALMVFSVFAGTVALTGSAAAAANAGSSSITPNTVDEQTTNTHSITLNATGIDTTGTNSAVFSVSLPSSLDISSSQVQNVQVNNGNVNYGGTSNVDSTNNNVTITLQDGSGSGAANDTVSVTFDLTNVAAPSVSSDTTASASYRVDHNNDGTWETSSTQFETLTINNIQTEVLSATHYDNDTSSASDPIVEVAFSNSNELDSPAAGDFTVNLEDGSTADITGVSEPQDGRVEISTDQVYTNVANVTVDSSQVDGTDDVTVDVTFAPVTVDASASNSPAVNTSAYIGSNIAVRAGSTGATFDFSGEYTPTRGTGDNSQVFVIDTDNLDTGNIAVDTNDDGTTNANIQLESLGLDVSADDVTDDTAVTGTVEADDINRNVDVMLLDSDGDAVSGATDSVSLGSSGDAEFNLGTVDAGNYTVVATDVNTGVEATTDVNVTEAAAGEVTFAQNTYEVAQGGIAEITLDVSGTTQGTLVIGDETESGYQANVTFTDENDDGEVTVQFNTYNAGTTGDVVSAAGDDTANVIGDDTSLDNLLAQNGYNLAVDTGLANNGTEVTTSGDADFGSLSIGPRSTDGMTLWTAPAGAASDEVFDSTLTEDTTIAQDDWVVHQVSATGLEGLVDGNLSAALGNGLNVTVEQTEASTRPNRGPKTLNVSASGDAVALWADADNDSYYIAVDTETAVFDRGSRMADFSANAGEEYTATFTVDDSRLVGEDDESVNATFEIVERTASLDETPVMVEAAEGQNITGSSSIAPGSEFRVVIESTGDTSPRFYNNPTATVEADGTWTITMDFSEQAEGDTFRVANSQFFSADGEVGAAATATPTATATPEETEEPETDTATATATATATDAPETDEPTPTATDEPDTTTTTTPGFGIAVALVALLAAALLAGRRE